MEFPGRFEIAIPRGSPAAGVADREQSEASAAAKLADEGRPVRLGRTPASPGATTAVGPYREEGEAELGGALRAPPMYDGVRSTVTPLEPRPNDPAAVQTDGSRP
jgi:muconolactone delta-isomerase